MSKQRAQLERQLTEHAELAYPSCKTGKPPATRQLRQSPLTFMRSSEQRLSAAAMRRGLLFAQRPGQGGSTRVRSAGDQWAG